MSDKEVEQNEFRLTSPDDSNELDQGRAQSSGGWESQFRRVPLRSNKDQLRLWFEDAATYASREFVKSFNEIRESEEPKPGAGDLVVAVGALLMVGWLFRARNENSECRPPFKAEYILYLFLRREERDEVIGDLIESYGQVVRRFGKRWADIWFYKQVAGSLLPLLRQSLLRLGAFVWLGRILRRLIS